MAKARKHQFHCEKCGAPCEIYRKGKKHRVLVCPSCGVLATNPLSFKTIAKRAARAVAGEIPGASLVMEGAGLVSDTTQKEPTATTSRPRNVFTTEERVRMALGTR